MTPGPWTRPRPRMPHCGVKGTLIVESIQVGSTLRALLVVHEIRRFATSDVAEYQPSVWRKLTLGRRVFPSHALAMVACPWSAPRPS